MGDNTSGKETIKKKKKKITKATSSLRMSLFNWFWCTWMRCGHTWKELILQCFLLKKTGKGMANIPISRGEAQILTQEEKVQCPTF